MHFSKVFVWSKTQSCPRFDLGSSILFPYDIIRILYNGVLIYIYIYIEREIERVIKWLNELSEQVSNSWWCCLHFTLSECRWGNTNANVYFSPKMIKIVGWTDISCFRRGSSKEEEEKLWTLNLMSAVRRMYLFTLRFHNEQGETLIQFLSGMKLVSFQSFFLFI